MTVVAQKGTTWPEKQHFSGVFPASGTQDSVPGTLLSVEVKESGFWMDGKCYRSLTSIASQITGVHWSGPRFFGVR